jgi:PGF-pre-PGF domain-containing protein
MLGSYANGYYYNSSVLGANTYQYRFVANDSSGNTNVTPILYFTIAQAPTNISLYLNETENNYSYTQNSVANFTVTVNISGKIVNLTSNYTGWIEQYNTTPLYNYTTLSTLGNFWNITGFFEGDENYSASSKTYYFNVTDVSPPEWSNNVTSIASGSQYSSGQSYQFNVTWNESESSISVVLIEHNFTGGATPHNETVSNESSVYYFSVNDLATGTYVWKEYANNTEDYWNVTNNGNYWSYTITSLVQPITSLSNEPYVPSTVNKIVLTKGNVSIIIPSIAYGKIARISIARYEDVALRQMNIDVVNSANNIKITITKLSDLPSSINKILARVYHYINIEKTNITDSDIRMVNISFAVNKTWLIANNVDASNVTFYRWAEEQKVLDQRHRL